MSKADQWRVEPGTSWARYRGRGRPGKVPIAAQDDSDLRLALAELAVGREMLRQAHELFTNRIGIASARRGALNEAVARLQLAVRMVDEVIERRGGIAGDLPARQPHSPSTKRRARVKSTATTTSRSL